MPLYFTLGLFQVEEKRELPFVHFLEFVDFMAQSMAKV